MDLQFHPTYMHPCTHTHTHVCVCVCVCVLTSQLVIYNEGYVDMSLCTWLRVTRLPFAANKQNINQLATYELTHVIAI